MRRQLKKLAVVAGMVTLMTGATSVMGDLTESNSSYYNFSVSAHGGSQSTGVVKKQHPKVQQQDLLQSHTLTHLVQRIHYMLGLEQKMEILQQTVVLFGHYHQVKLT